jgi:hypothetical protein
VRAAELGSFVKFGLLAGTALVAFGAPPPPTFPDVPSSYQLKLKSFVVPPAGSVGLLIIARVNGGPPLRLLLDSGTQFLVLDRKAAARSNCKGTAGLDLVGAGEDATRAVRTGKAGTVEVGDLVLKDVDVAVADGKVLEGIDGAFPLSAFAGFLIRLDVPARRLDLSPYSLEKTAAGSGALPASADNGLLFVKCVLNETHEGYFLLDTGATYNAISANMAKKMSSTAALGRAIPMQGGAAAVDARVVTEILSLRVGSRALRADPILAIDLSTASRYHRFEVSGLLGYPAFRDSVLTINYRDKRLNIAPK